MRKRGRKTDFRTLGQEEKFRESRESLYSPKVLTSSRQRNDGVIQRAEVKRSKRKEEKREREELARVEGVGFVRSGAVLMITSGFAITTTLCRILLLANLKRDETQTGWDHRAGSWERDVDGGWEVRVGETVARIPSLYISVSQPFITIK